MIHMRASLVRGRIISVPHYSTCLNFTLSKQLPSSYAKLENPEIV